MFGSIFDNFPTWVVFCVSAALFLAVSEIGFRIGSHVRETRAHIESGSTGLVTGSILGLVSFLLAFTFGIAASNYSERRGVVLDEANVIGTAYLRADLLPDTVAKEFRSLLMQYTEIRTMKRKGLEVEELIALVRGSEVIQRRVWEIAADALRAAPNPANALIASAVNDLIDLHSVRVSVGVRHTIPQVIWWALYLISAIALATTGYRFGASYKQRSELLPGMVFAFACLITLISDLDDPRHGFLVSDQRPLVDLLASMKAADS
jgi:putative Mn2+ efflux pump MntP